MGAMWSWWSVIDRLAWIFCEMAFKGWALWGDSTPPRFIDAILWKFYRLGCWIYGKNTRW